MLESHLFLIIGFLAGGFVITVAWLVYALKLRTAGQHRPADSSTEERSARSTLPTGEEDNATPDPFLAESDKNSTFKLDQVYVVAEKLESFLKRTAHPKDLLERSEFQQGTMLLKASNLTDVELISYGSGSNVTIACMALDAVRQRESTVDVSWDILKSLDTMRLWPIYYAIKALESATDRPIIGAVLAHIDSYWNDNLLMQSILKEFIQERLAMGEAPTFKGQLNEVAEDSIPELDSLIETLSVVELEPLKTELTEWQRTRVDVATLRGIGVVWSKEKTGSPIIEHPKMGHLMRELELALLTAPKRSVLLIGEPGVGKTTLSTIFARKLQKDKWTIFEAGATEVLAGQKYIGELEGRIQELISNLGGNRKVLWLIPNFHQLVFAGHHQNDPRSILDMLMPALESGQLTIIGETEPDAYERLLRLKPRLRTVLKGISIAPMDNEEALALARRWNEVSHRKKDAPLIEAQVLEEAFHLSRQFLDKAASPGNLIGLIKWTLRNINDPLKPLTIDAILHSLTQLTGLPASILDQRQDLDLNALRGLFQQRVLGQVEAVDCLVDRVAMIKAGLNDPTKPAGVFLFVGPTGTGKTEIAKTLAEFLFGSSDRMIRFDMSEFMSEDSLHRLIGERDRTSESRALVNLIRNQPFSVILLDEFEKAHPKVWDLFLQVFDDGRLTDRLGNTADFRHSIIIMTSNLGAAIPQGSGVGFSGDRKGFSESSVTRAVQTAFRPEFLNRIDRVVVFRPLSRSVVRKILLKELNDVISRRGFRNKDWAVEWEESALDFLLDKGFTEELGARPLKRAIERYVLSPLAITIVQNQFPEGDQFLFVRSAGKALEVEFIDPDATEADAPKAEDIKGRPAEEDINSLKPLILDARGTPAEVDRMESIYEKLCDEVESDEWQLKKEASLALTASPEFWSSSDRFKVLAEVEYMDRLERGLDTAESLFNRLRGEGDEPRSTYSKVLVQRLAHRLYLLENAIEGEASELPRDAFLSIEVGQNSRTDPDVLTFANDLTKMYLSWVDDRQMRSKILVENRMDAEGIQRFVIAIAGFGAFALLRHETGIHVWEDQIEDTNHNRKKINVHVKVVPQPIPASKETNELIAQAEHQFTLQEGNRTTIVRRYMREPSPLVRDRIKGWRTGNLNLVLKGNFDLMG